MWQIVQSFYYNTAVREHVSLKWGFLLEQLDCIEMSQVSSKQQSYIHELSYAFGFGFLREIRYFFVCCSLRIF